MVKRRIKINLKAVILNAILIVLALICFIPFYNIFVNATHDNAAIASGYRLIFGNQLLENYNRLISYVNIWRSMLNSFVIAIISTVISCYFGSLTAFGFAKYKFKYNKVLFGILLATMMLPVQLSIIGYFQLMDKFRMLDTFQSLIMPAFYNAHTVFFIRQYMKANVPDSLLESARIEGAGELRIFHNIVFPIITPVVFTQAIFLFVMSWNNFLNPLILIFSQDKLTLPVVIQQMKGTYETNYGVIYTGVAISVIPIIMIAGIFLRRIVGQLTVGAVKE